MGLRGYINPRQFPDVLSGQDCTLCDRAKTRERRATSPVFNALLLFFRPLSLHHLVGFPLFSVQPVRTFFACSDRGKRSNIGLAPLFRFVRIDLGRADKSLPQA
jgi:hypothetical protein